MGRRPQRHIALRIPIFALSGRCVALNMGLPLKPVSAARYCRRRGEEIALANDLDSEPDIDRDRRIIFVEGEPRPWTPELWRLFTLLYRWRGNVVPRVRVDDQRQNLSMLRRLLAGSRYQIVTRKSIGYELIVAPDSAEAKLPRVRDMVSAALEPEGLSRAEIAAAISREYGIEISVNTLRFFADCAAKKWPLRGSLRRLAG